MATRTTANAMTAARRRRQGETFVFGSRQPAQQSTAATQPRPFAPQPLLDAKVCPGGRGQGRPPPIGPLLGAQGETARILFVFGSGQLPAYQAKADDFCDIGTGQVLPHGPTQQQVSPRLPQINPGARGGGSENFFAFGTTRPLGSPTPGEAATVPSDTPLCGVTLRDLLRGQ